MGAISVGISSVGATWNCKVCGKQHLEEEKARKCVICGRQKHARPQRISVLSTQFKSFDQVDVRLQLASPIKEEAARSKRVHWGGFEGRQSLFLFKGTEYEEIDRTALKDDTASVLASIRGTLETCKS